MFLDTRLGNTPRWFLRRKDWSMRVPDEVLKSVVFVGRIVGTGGFERRRCGGTAFIASIRSEEFPDVAYTYIVTARHVAKQLSLGGPWFMRYNLTSGGSQEAIADDGEGWWYHPTEAETVDAAVHVTPTHEEMDFRHVPISMFATDEVIQQHNIGPGDMVFFTGLFSKIIGKARNIPIVRTGNIAMLPAEKVPVKIDGCGVESEVYLVEARSLGGLSGSPVFVRETVYLTGMAGEGNDRRRVEMQIPGAFFLFGVMHGHWNVKMEDSNEIELPPPKKDELPLNLGVAVVTPAKRILEILNRPELVEERRRRDRERRESEGYPTPD